VTNSGPVRLVVPVTASGPGLIVSVLMLVPLTTGTPFTWTVPVPFGTMLMLIFASCPFARTAGADPDAASVRSSVLAPIGCPVTTW
jgi:hypothetical protein